MAYDSSNLPQPSLRTFLARPRLPDSYDGDDTGFHRFVEEEDGAITTEIAHEEDQPPGKDQISSWQAGWNVTNAIQGMFLVSLPYAVLHGGYWSLVGNCLVASVCCYTGKVLVDCLYEDGVRVRTSYMDIAQTVFESKIGAHVVNAAAITEALMTCILYLVLCGDLMIGCFPNGPLSMTAWVTLSFVGLLPCAILTSLRHVSWISFWNTVTHIIINMIIIIYCLTLASQWRADKVQYSIDIFTFPISLGIIVFSYTSHIFLPTLEGNLVDKNSFKRMMNWTHVLAALFKALFGYIGFITFTDKTNQEITNNLMNTPLKITVNGALVLKAMFSYPLPYFAAAKFLDSTLFQDNPFPSCWNKKNEIKLWAVLPRALLILFTYVAAITVPHFANLCGLIGSFTGTMLSFVWPAYFHLKLRKHSAPLFFKIFDVFIIVLGFFFGIIGMYCSGRALYRAMNGIYDGNTLNNTVPLVPVHT